MIMIRLLIMKMMIIIIISMIIIELLIFVFSPLLYFPPAAVRSLHRAFSKQVGPPLLYAQSQY